MTQVRSSVFNTSLDGSENVTEPVTEEYINGTVSQGEGSVSVTHLIERYTIPIIFTLGITGNTLATVIFLRKPLRTSSCSIFLAARGISDNGFLSTLLLIWISSTFNLQLSAIAGLCQIIIFLTYVCGCISVWLVVFVTSENYIRICRPFIVNRVCKTRIAKISLLVLCMVVLAIYNFPFWAMSAACKPYERYGDIIQGMVYADTFLTLVLPTICISCLMTAIICSLIKSYNRRSRLSAPTAKRVKNPMAKVTKMLLAVSVTFFCLNLPSHVIRLWLMIGSWLDPKKEITPLERGAQHITLFVYYMSLSINLFVYLIFGSRFRKTFIRTYFNKETAVNLVPTGGSETKTHVPKTLTSVLVDNDKVVSRTNDESLEGKFIQ